MKRVCIVLSTLLLSSPAVVAINIEKIDPPFWYVGMEDKSLQLMVYGKDIANAKVDVSYPGVQISSTVRLDSDNYLLVYLQLSDEVAPGNVKLSFEAGKRRIEKAYELKARTMLCQWRHNERLCARHGVLRSESQPSRCTPRRRFGGH